MDTSRGDGAGPRSGREGGRRDRSAAAVSWRRAWCGVALVLATTAIVVGCGEDQAAVRTVTVQPGETPTPPAPEPPAVEEKPDAEYSHNCSYVLGEFTASGLQGSKLVADATVTNTGNVGIVAELRASWKQAGSPRIRKKRQVRIPYGGVRDIGVSVPITQGQIDLIQAASDPNCTATVAIVNTFGATHD